MLWQDDLLGSNWYTEMEFLYLLYLENAVVKGPSRSATIPIQGARSMPVRIVGHLFYTDAAPPRQQIHVDGVVYGGCTS